MYSAKSVGDGYNVKILRINDDDIMVDKIERIQVDSNKLLIRMISGAVKTLDFSGYEKAVEFRDDIYTNILGWA